MSKEQVEIRVLSTGVPGLDTVLGGGLPEFSFNIIAGEAGAGKTTLAQKIVFTNATPQRPALYFTVLGEPTLKLLRYQQQYTFFDPDRVGTDVRFINLSREVLDGDLGKVLERVVKEVEAARPGLVVVDSFRTVSDHPHPNSAMDLERFVQALALQLTTWEVTSFLIGEYITAESRNPVFTVADGVLWLSQSAERHSTVRQLQVVKMRGMPTMPGFHTFRITTEGVRIFPRMFQREPVEAGARAPSRPPRRLSSGIQGLDEMLGGGYPAGDAVLLTGASGTGKTTFSNHFIAAAQQAGESAVMAIFEENPTSYLARARQIGLDLEAMRAAGRLKMLYLRPLDLSVDETLLAISEAVAEVGATRVVIDSLSGFELALAPTFRDDFREAMYRLVTALTSTGVTVMMTIEVSYQPESLSTSTQNVSFLSDDIIVQRFVELEGELRTVVTVMKMRGSQHSRALRAYQISPRGVVLGEVLREYQGVITGVPRFDPRPRSFPYRGLSDQEAVVFDTLVASRRDLTAEELALAANVGTGELQDALHRLVRLDYALGVERDGAAAYRALARRGPW
ncbi:MAG: ATPase domain-containing protein [Pseudomonadota bacterium]|nr:ATPase domain-containing protein [Pseudomonadota bacterium]